MPARTVTSGDFRNAVKRYRGELIMRIDTSNISAINEPSVTSMTELDVLIQQLQDKKRLLQNQRDEIEE